MALGRWACPPCHGGQLLMLAADALHPQPHLLKFFAWTLGQVLMNAGNARLDVWDAVKGKHVTSVVAQVRNVVSGGVASGDAKVLVANCLLAGWLACLPACLLVCLPACLPAAVRAGTHGSTHARARQRPRWRAGEECGRGGVLTAAVRCLLAGTTRWRAGRAADRWC